MRKALFLIFACLAGSPAWSLTVQGGPLGLGAAPMGAAGAVVALPTGADSLYWNPAGMGGDQDLGFIASGGTGGDVGPSSLGLNLLVPLEDCGNFAVGGRRISNPSDTVFNSNQVLLGGAFEINHGLWVGTTQKYWSADPGSLSGWSMDIGFQSEFDLGGDWGNKIRVGLNLADAASSLVWGNGVLENQPMTVEAGLAWRAFGQTWLALEDDWMDQDGEGLLSQWRLGLNSAWSQDRFIVRLGATQLSGASDLFGTAGLGSHVIIAGTRIGLDYAIVAPLSSPAVLSGPRHLLSLSMDFGAKAPAVAGVSFAKLLKDPRTNRIQHARINLSAEDGDRAADWELRISNASGKVLRSFKGKGPLPPSVTWDGKGDKGGLVEDDGLSYSSAHHLAQRAPAPQERQLAGPQPGRRGPGGSGGVRRRRLRPSRRHGARRPAQAFAREAQPQGQRAVQAPGRGFRLERRGPGAGEQLGTAHRGRVRQHGQEILGQRPASQELELEGKSDLGDTVDGAIGASYVLRVENESGKTTESSDDLVRDEDFSKLVKDKPLNTEERVSSAGIGTTVCQRDFESGGWVCTVRFADGQSSVDGKVLAQVREAAQVVKKSQLPVLEIKGYADKGEGDARGLREDRPGAGRQRPGKSSWKATT